MSITFSVFGVPRPQGSKRAFNRPGSKHPVLVESAGKPLKDWRLSISQTAAEAVGEKPIVGPVSVRLEFAMPRPKAHYRTGANAEKLKQSAPEQKAHVQRPDIDKLIRAVLDALSKVAFRDDSCVTELVASKYWTSRSPGVRITIEEVES